MDLKVKSKIPSGWETDDFTQFQDLARKLVSVSKKDIYQREKKAGKTDTGNRQS